MPERDHEKELRAIMDALAESVATASDKDILEEATNAGEDVEGVADRLRARLLEAVGDYRQRRLKSARRDYEETLAAIERPTLRLPDTHKERRALFDAVLANNPAIGNLLTAQHRDLKGLSDSDVEGCLRHLQILGVLDSFPTSEEEA